MSDRPALVLVGTPIGNMADLSPRAIEELSTVDLICCEDTRRTGRLLQLAGIERRPLLMVNDHNEAERCEDVVQRVAAGERVAVVTDAGMPGISDPGERLVAAVVAAGLVVEVVPGPSAGIAALVASGMATGRFVFEGFLPRKAMARSARLTSLAAEPRTLVFYEAPHRIRATLVDLAEAFGPARRVAVARELTKMYEAVWRGSMEEAVGWADATPPRGEIVLVVDGAPAATEPTNTDVVEALRQSLAAGGSNRDAVAAAVDQLGVPKKRAYALALEMDPM